MTTTPRDWKPRLGERVRARAAFDKRGGNDWECRPLPEPVEGIVTAQRTRRYMVEDWETDDYSGRSYRTLEFGEGFVAYDVTFDLHRRPLVCALVDLEPAQPTANTGEPR